MKNVKRTLLAAALLACAIACGKKESPSPQIAINPNNPTDTTSIPKPTPIDSCGTDNPVEKLSWIGDLRLKSYAQPRMYSYIYENKMVFAFSPCFDCGDDKMTIFNCKGETLAEGKAKCDVMLQKANRQKLVFDGNLTDCDRVKNPATDIAWIAELISDYKKAIDPKEVRSRIYSCLYKGNRIYFLLQDNDYTSPMPELTPWKLYGASAYVTTCSNEYIASFGCFSDTGNYIKLLSECSHPILIYNP